MGRRLCWGKMSVWPGCVQFVIHSSWDLISRTDTTELHFHKHFIVSDLVKYNRLQPGLQFRFRDHQGSCLHVTQLLTVCCTYVLDVRFRILYFIRSGGKHSCHVVNSQDVDGVWRSYVGVGQRYSISNAAIFPRFLGIYVMGWLTDQSTMRHFMKSRLTVGLGLTYRIV